MGRLLGTGYRQNSKAMPQTWQQARSCLGNGRWVLVGFGQGRQAGVGGWEGSGCLRRLHSMTIQANWVGAGGTQTPVRPWEGSSSWVGGGLIWEGK